MAINPERIKRYRQQVSGGGGGAKRDYLKTGEYNRWRLFDWPHEWNEFDVAWGRCQPEDVGRTDNLWYLPIEEQYTGPGNKIRRVCLPFSCPWKEEFWTRQPDSKGSRGRDKPKRMYYLAVVDYNNPQKGVQYVALSEWDFNGAIRTGFRMCHGVRHIVEGYDPAEDEENDIQTQTPAFNGYWNKVLGHHGCDIILHKKAGLMKMNANAKIIDYTRKNANGVISPIEVVAAEHCTALDQSIRPRDVHLAPQYQPGFSTDKNCLPDFQRFSAWLSSGGDSDGTVDQVQPQQQPEPREEELPGGRIDLKERDEQVSPPPASDPFTTSQPSAPTLEQTAAAQTNPIREEEIPFEQAPEPSGKPEVEGASQPAQQTNASPAPSQGPSAGRQPGDPPTDASTDLQEIGLSKRAAGPLIEAGITTLGALAGTSLPEIRKLNGIGPSSVKEIQSVVEGHGYTMAAPQAREIPREMEDGMAVFGFDSTDEEGKALPEEQWTRFRGTFKRYITDDVGNTRCVVEVLPPAEQDDEDGIRIAEYVWNNAEANKGALVELPPEAVRIVVE